MESIVWLLSECIRKKQIHAKINSYSIRCTYYKSLNLFTSRSRTRSSSICEAMMESVQKAREFFTKIFFWHINANITFIVVFVVVLVFGAGAVRIETVSSTFRKVLFRCSISFASHTFFVMLLLFNSLYAIPTGSA